MYDLATKFHTIECRYCGRSFKTRYGRYRYCPDRRCRQQAHPRREPRYPRWTHQEIRTLRQLAGKMPPKQIAQRLGRTHQAVIARARMLSISLMLYGEYHPAAKYSGAVVEEARSL